MSGVPTSAEIIATATVERHDALRFAERTLINLRVIQQIYEAHRDEPEPPVRFVTHIVNSLLGLVVFTCEKKFVRFTVKEKLANLSADWPAWQFGLGGSQNDTLGELAYHLRNAASHARVTFSSDSHDPEKVVVTFEDAHPQTKQIYWRASIGAADLLAFCFLYAEHLDQIIN